MNIHERDLRFPLKEALKHPLSFSPQDIDKSVGFQVVLGHAPEGLDVSQLTVGGDDLGGAMRSLTMLVTWPLVRREVALECWVFFGLCVFCVSCCDFAAQ